MCSDWWRLAAYLQILNVVLLTHTHTLHCKHRMTYTMLPLSMMKIQLNTFSNLKRVNFEITFHFNLQWLSFSECFSVDAFEKIDDREREWKWTRQMDRQMDRHNVYILYIIEFCSLFFDVDKRHSSIFIICCHSIEFTSYWMDFLNYIFPSFYALYIELKKKRHPKITRFSIERTHKCCVRENRIPDSISWIFHLRNASQI